ncbi:hypothetical protein F4777DRAFT_567666 [Nemania sp. FL0916]|nr:hypothetical protein F4777DRAFT_567666 [Nemania sp. FL0916]
MADIVGTTRTPLAFSSADGLPSYKWAVDAGEIAQIPSFQKITSDWNALIDWKSRPQAQVSPPIPYTFEFNQLDCNTTSGSRNCTEACRDRTSLFTPTNLRVCSLLATTSLLVADRTFNFSLSDSVTAQIADEWQVPNLTSFDGAGVLANITDCITQSCTVAPDVGTCSKNARPSLNTPVTVGTVANLLQSLDHYCDSQNSVLNADIAGPGVIVSYLFQISLALLIYILVGISTNWPRRISNVLGLGRADLREKGHRVQTRLASSRFRATLISSLVEFQEVQLYFVGSIQVASFISFSPNNPNTSSSNSNSFSSALLSSAIINILGVNGVYTILLCQGCLQREGKRSWYIFVLMSIVFVLAQVIVGVGDSLLPSTEALWDKLKSDHPIFACGNNPSPMTYCPPPLGFNAALTTGAQGRHVFAISGSLAYFGLLVDQLAYASPSLVSTVTNKSKRLSGKPNITDCVRRAWPWLRHLYWFAIQVILLLGTILYFAILLEVVPRAGIRDTSKWSFGQIIAVTVWAPTIVKYIYSNVFGTNDDNAEESMSKEHIPRSERPSHENDNLLEHGLD